MACIVTFFVPVTGLLGKVIGLEQRMLAIRDCSSVEGARREASEALAKLGHEVHDPYIEWRDAGVAVPFN